MSQPKPLTAAELAGMDKDAVIAYVEAGGSLADVIRHAQQGTDVGPAPTELRTVEDEPMEVAAFRLPKAMIAQLEAAAGNDKAGKSGIVRLAVREYFSKLDRAS